MAEPTPTAPRATRSATRSLLEWVAVIAGAILVALLVRAVVVQPFYIPSESMEPTLQVDDRVLVNKLSYSFGDVGRGDIVVFERPEGLRASDINDLIKRVVATGGETVVIKDQRVFVDGVLLEETYLESGTTTGQGAIACTDAQPCQIPEGYIWVMGDNRSNSEDSRWFGPVPMDDVVGKAFVRMWPLGDVGLL